MRRRAECGVSWSEQWAGVWSGLERATGARMESGVAWSKQRPGVWSGLEWVGVSSGWECALGRSEEAEEEEERELEGAGGVPRKTRTPQIDVGNKSNSND